MHDLVKILDAPGGPVANNAVDLWMIRVINPGRYTIIYTHVPVLEHGLKYFSFRYESVVRSLSSKK